MACKLSENHWEFFLFFWLDNTNQKLEWVFQQSFTKKRYLLPRLQATAWYDYPFSSQEATILLAGTKSQNLWSGPIWQFAIHALLVVLYRLGVHSAQIWLADSQTRAQSQKVGSVRGRDSWCWPKRSLHFGTRMMIKRLLIRIRVGSLSARVPQHNLIYDWNEK